MKRLALAVGVCLCLGAAPGTLDGLADALAARARPSLAADLDVAVAVSAPSPRLARDLGALLLARLPARSAAPLVLPAGASDRSAAEAARAAGFERLVRVRLEAAGGRLAAEGAVLSIPPDLWSDQPVASAHLYAEAPLDDELRAYLGPGPARPPAFSTRVVPLGDVDLLALDVGDADGDGRPEVVGATASEAIAWRLDGDRAVEVLRLPFAGKPAPLRPRADLATVRVERGAIEARSSRFALGLRRAGSATATVEGFPLPGLAGLCALAPGVDWFTAASCGAPLALLPPRFWIAAGLRGGSEVVAAIEPPAGGPDADPSGKLWLKVGAAPPVEVPGVGAQLALASLEGRGPVVAVSEPGEPGDPDAIVVRALGPGAPVVRRVEGLPGGVRALAAGDLDGDGREEIVAAVRDRARAITDLWIVAE